MAYVRIEKDKNAWMVFSGDSDDSMIGVIGVNIMLYSSFVPLRTDAPNQVLGMEVMDKDNKMMSYAHKKYGFEAAACRYGILSNIGLELFQRDLIDWHENSYKRRHEKPAWPT